MIKRVIRYVAFRYQRLDGLYRRVCRPDSKEFAAYWKSQNRLHSIGDNCRINMGCNITDPAYVRIGNNCVLSTCTLLGHDGVAGVLNATYGIHLDAVGKIDIRDNCFVGHGAIVMPNTTIGPNSVVAAGAVVTKDVPPNTVVGGVPAKMICTTEELVSRLQERSKTYPWIDMIERREGPYDPAMEPELVRHRVKFFFPDPAN
jgi:acetyltransferase-like isoleucine patch superfamily enzyme